MSVTFHDFSVSKIDHTKLLLDNVSSLLAYINWSIKMFKTFKGTKLIKLFLRVRGEIAKIEDKWWGLKQLDYILNYKSGHDLIINKIEITHTKWMSFDIINSSSI